MVSLPATSSALPSSGYLRITQILGNPKANPPIPPLIPVGKSTWWNWVKEGRAPKSVKLSARVTAWRSEDIQAFILQLAAGSEQ